MNLLAKILILTIVIAMFFLPFEVLGQCPMCKTNLEGALQNEGSTVGTGINEGIMYLFFSPFICIGIVGYLWYRQSKKAVEA